MSQIITIVNASAYTFAHPLFAGVAPATSVSKRLIQQSIDDVELDYVKCAKVGIALVEGSTYTAGTYFNNNTSETPPVGAHVINSVVSSSTKVLTLPTITAEGGAGFKMWILLSSVDGGHQLTVTAGAGNTVLGGANHAMTTSGSVLRLVAVGTDWKAQ